MKTKRFETIRLIAAPWLAIGIGGFLANAAAGAQEPSSSTAREVVQPMPSEEVQRLNKALMALARQPQDVATLVEAGNAALQLNDLDAAIGFFGRASELEPDNPRAKMGMAATFMRSGRPIDALRLFREAEAAGASPREVLLDRALAYDLVGNNVEAQATYRQALAIAPSDEAVRRLALSYAIAGDSVEFERTLLPLLQERDVAAYRSRAFGLAILGDTGGAAAIADTMMPRDLAARMIPYLEFMPRLTRSQQAAAANLGVFPKAAEIGREDPRIAEFARQGSAIASAADARLAPAGAPLGQPASPVEVEEEVQAAAPAPGLASAQPRIPVEQVVDLEPRDNGPDPAQGDTLAEAASVEDAFSNFDLASSGSTMASSGAVDISKIEAPREVVEPPKPVHPSRVWVQVATGRNRSALRFDWRRIVRSAPDLLSEFDPHVAAWGRTNRLLAGPVANRSAARRLVNALKAEGVDTFSFVSAEGQQVQRLR